MKKKLIGFWLTAVIVFAAGSFVSCSDGNDDDGKRAVLSVEPTTLSFVSAGETKNVAVTAKNVTWKATTTDAWLTLSGDSGTESGTLTVTADPNFTAGQLNGSITISGEGAEPVTISVTQAGDDTPRSLVVSSQALTFTCSNYYSRTIFVDAENVNWEVAPDAEWIHVEKKPDAQSQDGIVVVTVDPNPGDVRKSSITLSGAGIEPVVIAVSQKAYFESELIGTYTPALKYWDALSQDAGDLFIDATWTTGMGPKIPIAIPGYFPDGVDWMMVDSFLLPMVGALYSQGLDSFTFRDDGTFAATYHAMTGEFMNPTFDSAISEFPTEETLAVLPGGALSYYTEEGMLYIAIDKAFLTEVGEESDIDDICSVIDAMLAPYSDLTLVSTPEYYAIPFKYSVENGVLTLYVDREMMLPYRPLLTDLLPLLLSSGVIDAETLAGLGIDPANPKPLTDFIDALFDTSTKLEIGLRLAKK